MNQSFASKQFFTSKRNHPAIRKSLVNQITFDSENFVIRFFGLGENGDLFNHITEWNYEEGGKYYDDVINLKTQL